MKEPLDDVYLSWLSAKVIVGDGLSRSYSSLLQDLYNHEFKGFIQGDGNRAEDGQDLRDDFLLERQVQPTDTWYFVACSIFEMMYALARRAEWQSDISAPEWFWMMVNNLGLGDYSDDNYDAPLVHTILFNFVERTYNYNGKGGLFPLREPQQDQTEVEIWYQLGAYLAEHDEIGL